MRAASPLPYCRLHVPPGRNQTESDRSGQILQECERTRGAWHTVTALRVRAAPCRLLLPRTRIRVPSIPLLQTPGRPLGPPRTCIAPDYWRKHQTYDGPRRQPKGHDFCPAESSHPRRSLHRPTGPRQQPPLGLTGRSGGRDLCLRGPTALPQPCNGPSTWVQPGCERMRWCFLLGEVGLS